MLRSTIMAHMSEALTESKYRFKQLQNIEAEINWSELSALIEPHYLASSIGHNLVSVDSMIRIYFLQLRYSMSASGVEEALFQIEVLREFAQIDMGAGVIPHESCINLFKQLIIEQGFEGKLESAFDLETMVAS
ncbi:MAG: transposase [Cocleimonas sp.]|nr:transposase [Cocleimonas sp.]